VAAMVSDPQEYSMKVTITKRPGDNVSFESICEREELEVKVHQKSKDVWVAQLACNPHHIGEGESVTEAIQGLVDELSGKTIEIHLDKKGFYAAFDLGPPRVVTFPQIMFLKEAYDDEVF
jgi:hypothetical protein